MDLSDCNISVIHPPDDLAPQSADESPQEQSIGEIENAGLPDDLDVSYVEESFVEEKFDQLLPSAYTQESFHVGQLIRYADHDRDTWYWGVVSKVGDVSNDGSFDMHLRLCGNIDPADNGVCLRFPGDFYEILIDDKSYQHSVTDIQHLSKGDHIRFRDAASNQWYMGWITTSGRITFKISFTCEYNRNQEMRFIFGNLTGVCRVPMLPIDVIESTFGGDLQWSEEDGSGGMIEFRGDASISMDNVSASETYWAQFKSGDINLLRDYYLKGTNEWASERKRLATEEQKWDSWWMKWPDQGVDIDTIKLDMVVTWAANLEGKCFKSFFSSGFFGHNKPGGLAEQIPYYKFALAHCARRVHTPLMYQQSLSIKQHAIYRYDKL